MPLVGPVPNQPGLWISAGYNGEQALEPEIGMMARF